MRKIYLIIALSLVFSSGCAFKKGLIKDGQLDDQQKAQAQLAFSEGAELLFINNEAALEKFNKAAKINPMMVAAYYNSGVALEALNRMPEAAQKYSECLQYKKDQAACLENLLIVKAKLNELPAAQDLVQSYLTEYLDAPFVFVAAAKLAFISDNLADAEKYARAAIEIDAENIEALYVMSRIFFSQKKFNASKFVAKNALEISPSHGGFHLLLAQDYIKLDLIHDALDSYKAAVEFYPSEEALESYALLLIKMGRVKDSLPILQRLVEVRPMDFRNYLHLGNSYMSNKMFNEAKEAYIKALSLDPSQKDINFNLGLLYYDFKPKDMPALVRMNQAKEYFTKYLEQQGLEPSRIKEVQGYLKSLNDKIEYEVESAKEAEAAVEQEKIDEEKIEEEKLEEEPVLPKDEDKKINKDVNTIGEDRKIDKDINTKGEDKKINKDINTEEVDVDEF